MLTAIWVMVAIAVVIGMVLGWSSIRFKVEGNPLAEKIDAILPQTQCGQCGFPGCRPYAEAIAKGEAEINQCPPGGEEGVKKLAELLGVEPKPLDETHGTPKPKSVAFIDEQTCIGCTLCIQACPVDAIAGAAKQMHTIIAAECTGCELCLPPCPVDCISMVPIAEDLPHWKWKHPVIMLRKSHEQRASERASDRECKPRHVGGFCPAGRREASHEQRARNVRATANFPGTNLPEGGVA